MNLDSSTGWPIFDRQRRHVRTPSGSFIPFLVIQRVGIVAALLIGIETTFGLTNWVTIPIAIVTLAWAGPVVDQATSHIRGNEYYRQLEEAEREGKEPGS